jgi:hypothetical protein
MMLTALSSNFSLPARDVGTWDICFSTLTEQRLVIDSKGISSRLSSTLCGVNNCRGGITPIDVTVIQTLYDRKHATNVRFPAKTNRRENVIWTEGERVKAEAGEVVQDIIDLRSKVRGLDFCDATSTDT